MEEAASRRERLRALREAQQLMQAAEEGRDEPEGQLGHGEEVNGHAASGKEADQGDAANDGPPPEVTFRNYLPRDEELVAGDKWNPPARVKLVDPTVPRAGDATGGRGIMDGTELMKSVAPRKPNWDLRRDVAKKLEKLDKRTQRAMVELIHEEDARRQEELTEEGDGDGDVEEMR
eukprot:TRINITY_DN26358_c0_g1_i1.p1 TRINITY_DN26358_c0_g1~~TRINITY_DN26358_c0_g1_i1.p1  ORF type:complete len:176 (+),score=58.59 TRINITY_DN26358_c0_g1_i1:576-1103(+)